MKSIKIISLLLAVFSYCHGQNLSGKYLVSTGDGNGTRTLAFDNGKFTDTISKGDMGVKGIGEGAYTVENKKLILKYLPVSIKDSSFYSLNISHNSAQSGFLSVRVEDESGGAMLAYIGLRDQYNKPLAFFFTDKNGTANLTLYNTLTTAYLVVDYIGYYDVSIPVADLLAKTSELLVKLRLQQKTYIEPKKEIYDFVITSPTTIVLSSKTNGKLLLTKK